MRMIALIDPGISLSGLMILGLYFSIVSKIHPDAIIRMKYRALLMNVTERGMESLSPVMDVTSIEELAKLAERQNVMTMHLAHDQKHYYIVQVERKACRYIKSQG